MSFQIKKLQVKAGDKLVVKNVTLEVKPGEIVALQGPNGSGKTTLGRGLAGDPGLTTIGTALIDKVDLLPLNPAKRLQNGLFLTFQHPVELPHISVVSFLKAIYFNLPNKTLDVFASELERFLDLLGLPTNSLERIMNQDFSGGEKKRLELLQLLLLKPKYAILDELDSGVDKNSLKLFAKVIREMAADQQTGFLVVSHYPEFLELLRPDRYLTLTEGVLSASL